MDIENNKCTEYLDKIRYIGFVPIERNHAYMYYYMYGPDTEIKIEYKDETIKYFSSADINMNKSLSYLKTEIIKKGVKYNDSTNLINEFFNWLVNITIPGYDIVFKHINEILNDINLSSNDKVRQINKILREIGIKN